VFGLVWFAVLYLLACAVAGGIGGTMAGIRDPDQAGAAAAAARALIDRYGLLILAGTFVFVLPATTSGMLPGTGGQRRRRPGPGERGPWGPVASVVITIILLAASTVPVVAGAALTARFTQSPEETLSPARAGEALANDGFLLAISAILGALFTVPLTMLAARVRRGPKVPDYLALSPVRLGEVLKWLLITLGIIAVSDLLALLLRSKIVPDMLIQQYRTARFVPLYFAAIVLAAPVYEELLFRGFAFRGLLDSRAGAIGAVMITSFIWSIGHLQYDIAHILNLFVFGVVIGLARLTTGSVYPSVLIHATMNFVAFVEIAFLSGRSG
jgi:hypothetical protein